VAIAAIAYSSSVNYIFNNLLRKHQQERIWVWLRPEKCDPLGPLYNLEQSKFAIGSGGWTGKGFLQGERTKLDYVPEQSTDFIFCTVGEEWGYLGTSFIIIVFFALIFRVFQIANRQRSSFARFYAYCVASILFFHVFINIGMTIGLVPVIGIPLPFISYGGSSLMSFSILMGILIKLDSGRLSSFR
jgi:rod shape determining protein RodA